MKKIYALLIILSTSFSVMNAQDTFSIVVVDTATGELGSAGASCIPNSIIISDIIDGRGVIHTQSYWVQGNKTNGHSYMEEGYSPDSIIILLVQNDVQGDSTRRQYGVVDLKKGGRAAAYTGSNCLDYKAHKTGKTGPYTYSIQGNILLGTYVIDSIESGFLSEKGPLENKMMAALQGANFPGADSRCLDSAQGYSKPAISAFIRLSKPGDFEQNSEYYMDLNVGNTKPEENPIYSLQKLFDAFEPPVFAVSQADKVKAILSPNPVKDHAVIKVYPYPQGAVSLLLTDMLGKMILEEVKPYGNEFPINVEQLKRGVYFYSVKTLNGIAAGKVVVE